MAEQNTNPTLKDHELMYRMIISQLFYDGHQKLAIDLSSIVQPPAACPPSNRLMRVVHSGLLHEDEYRAARQEEANGVLAAGVDLEFDSEVDTVAPEASEYETCYVTSHKQACRAVVFHPNGQLIATGSEDSSIKILDVERMLSKGSASESMETPQQQMEAHPVIRTLYDHYGEVTALGFHPYEQILCSGSKDYSIRFFDYAKPSVKKAFKHIREASEVRSLSYHPSGDYIIVGTVQPTLRLYDVTTSQCFVSPCQEDHHNQPITSVNYSPNANIYATSSKDGNIRLWDGVSGRCVTVFSKAHDGAEVCSVQFSRNSKYLLSSGKDSVVKMWELSTARCLIAYTGAGATAKQEHRAQAVFNHTEDYVLFPDERTASLCCWDARNADRKNLLSLSHNAPVRALAHSSTGPAFITGSDDNRARFWYKRAVV